MMQVLYDTYKTLLPIIATAIMGYVVWYLQTQKKAEITRIEEENKRQEAICEGTKAILLYMLERLYTEFKMQKFVTKEQRDRFEELWNVYSKGLNGNGFGTALWEYVKTLEIRNDETIISPYAQLLKEVYDKNKKA